MKKFALIGVAGYVAPRHMKAIKDTQNQLIAALDQKDSVGIIDSYFPEADFFTEFERFDRHLDKRRRLGDAIDYVSICSPNYLHDAHIRFALRNRSHAICEKPLVLNPWNLNALEEIERESGRRVYNVLQLRLHPSIRALRAQIAAEKQKTYDVDLTYITARGHWYFTSWKGDVQKSGGIATNIGVHFFDMLGWIFGPCTKNIVHIHRPDIAAGLLHFKQARVRWFLSINVDHLPKEKRKLGDRTYRSMAIDGEEVDFSKGFTDLHTECYADILRGGGFSIADARASIETVYEIRHATPVGLIGEYHPYCTQIADNHE